VKRIMTTAIAAAALALRAEEAPKLETPIQKASYAIGADMSRNLSRQGIELDVDAFTAALRTGLAGGKLVLTDEQIGQELQGLQARAKEAFMKKRAEASGKNLETGKKFLEDNKKVEGVVALPSGLQYKEIKKGTGDKPKSTDTVSVHYTGKLLNGEVFDSSVARGEPATFPLNQVIKGWTEGVQLMNTGSKYEFWIPSELAYGDQGAGGKIEPGSTLHFEVELIKIEK
jgi:FKBP-type peptidyl-prolyl cis-trans isomerase